MYLFTKCIMLALENIFPLICVSKYFNGSFNHVQAWGHFFCEEILWWLTYAFVEKIQTKKKVHQTGQNISFGTGKNLYLKKKKNKFEIIKLIIHFNYNWYCCVKKNVKKQSLPKSLLFQPFWKH